MNLTLHHLDDRILFAVNDFARNTPWLHSAALAFTTYGVVLFAALLLWGLLRSRGRSDSTLAASAWAGVAVLLAVAVNQPIGRAVHEGRPYLAHPHLLALAQRTSDFSFPSDHAVMAGAAAAGLLLVWRRLGLVTVALALLLAFSRVYVAAHYPWDVVAGLAFGAAVSVGGWLLLRRPLTALARSLRDGPVLRSYFAATPRGVPSDTRADVS